jgi:hypothetical protein
VEAATRTSTNVETKERQRARGDVVITSPAERHATRRGRVSVARVVHHLRTGVHNMRKRD